MLFVFGDEDADSTLVRHELLRGNRRERVRGSSESHTAARIGWLVAAGSMIRKTLPFPTTLSTSMLPAFSATSE